MDLEAIRKAAREGIEPKREEPKPKGDPPIKGRALDANKKRHSVKIEISGTGITGAEAVKAMKLFGENLKEAGHAFYTHTHTAPTGPVGPPQIEASSEPIGRLEASRRIVVWLWGRLKRLALSLERWAMKP